MSTRALTSIRCATRTHTISSRTRRMYPPRDAVRGAQPGSTWARGCGSGRRKVPRSCCASKLLISRNQSQPRGHRSATTPGARGTTDSCASARPVTRLPRRRSRRVCATWRPSRCSKAQVMNGWRCKQACRSIRCSLPAMRSLPLAGRHGGPRRVPWRYAHPTRTAPGDNGGRLARRAARPHRAAGAHRTTCTALY